MSSEPGADAEEGMKIDEDESEECLDYSMKLVQQNDSSPRASSSTKPEQGAGNGAEPGVEEDDSEEMKPLDGTEEAGCYFLRQKCQICGAPAANHLHYGAFCCYSCRAFFRRSGERTYKCSSGNNTCKVENNTRKACKKCRYRLCLEAGMKPSLVDRHVKKKKGPEDEVTNRNLQPLKLKLKSKLVHKMRTNQAVDQRSDGSPISISTLTPLQVSTSYFHSSLSPAGSNRKSQEFTGLHSTEIKIEQDNEMNTSKYGLEHYKNTSNKTTRIDIPEAEGGLVAIKDDNIDVDIKQEDSLVDQPIEVSKGESPPSIWSRPNLWSRVLSTSPDAQNTLQNLLSLKNSPSPTHRQKGFPQSSQSSPFEMLAPMLYGPRQSPHTSPLLPRASKLQVSSQSPQASSSLYQATLSPGFRQSPQLSPSNSQATMHQGFNKSPQISPPSSLKQGFRESPQQALAYSQAVLPQGFHKSPQISPSHSLPTMHPGFHQSLHLSSAHSQGFLLSTQVSPSQMPASMRQGIQSPSQTSPSQMYSHMMQGIRLPNHTSVSQTRDLLQFAKSKQNLQQSHHSSSSYPYPIFHEGQFRHQASHSQQGSPPSPNKSPQRSFERCFRPSLGQLSPTLGVPVSPRFMNNMVEPQSVHPRLENPNYFTGDQAQGVQSRAIHSSYSSPSDYSDYSTESRVGLGVEVIKKARISVICGPRRNSDKIISNQSEKASDIEETRIDSLTQNDCTLLRKIITQQDDKDDHIKVNETNNNNEDLMNPIFLLKSLAAKDLLYIPDSPIMKLTLEEQQQCRYLIWTWESAHIGVEKIRNERVEIETDMDPEYVKNKEATDIRESIKEYFEEKDSDNAFNTFFTNQSNFSLLNGRLKCNILLGISCRMYGGDGYTFFPEIPEAKERFWRKYSYLLRSPWASSLEEELEIRNIMLETANLLSSDRVIEVLFTNCVISGFTTGYEPQEVNLASLGIEDDVYPRNQTLLLFRYLKFKEGEDTAKITFSTLKNLVPKLERAVTIFFENRLMI